MSLQAASRIRREDVGAVFGREPWSGAIPLAVLWATDRISLSNMQLFERDAFGPYLYGITISTSQHQLLFAILSLRLTQTALIRM